MGRIKLPLIILIVIVIIVVVLAIILGKETIPNNGSNNKVPKGVEISQEIYGFSGTITNIKDKTITIDAQILLADTTKEPLKLMIKANVPDQTKITKMVFPKNPPAGQPIYPKETTLQFNDLKIGDKVDVGTSKNITENLNSGTIFDLQYIYLIEQ